jgi:hypothetical protein
MTDSLRITVDELRRQMEAGEDFTLVDVRGPQVGQNLNSTRL